MEEDAPRDFPMRGMTRIRHTQSSTAELCRASYEGDHISLDSGQDIAKVYEFFDEYFMILANSEGWKQMQVVLLQRDISDGIVSLFITIPKVKCQERRIVFTTSFKTTNILSPDTSMLIQSKMTEMALLIALKLRENVHGDAVTLVKGGITLDQQIYGGTEEWVKWVYWTPSGKLWVVLMIDVDIRVPSCKKSKDS